MPQATAIVAGNKNSFTLIAASVGGVFLLAGIAVAAMGHATAGITLRSIAVACFAVLTARKPSLMSWTFLLMLAGIEIGLDAPHIATQLRLPGDLFLRLIRMIVAPLIFGGIVTGIAGHSELRGVGRVALKALIFFEVVTTAGLILGAVAINLSQAGCGRRASRPPLESAAPPCRATLESWQQIAAQYLS